MRIDEICKEDHGCWDGDLGVMFFVILYECDGDVDGSKEKSCNGLLTRV